MRAPTRTSTSSTDPGSSGGAASSDGSALLQVGRIAKAHGLRGEVIVELSTNRTERVEPGTVLSAEGRELSILRSSPHTGRWIVAFEGVTSREQADALRGTILSAPPLEDPEALWVHQLLGAEVVGVDGAELGTVVAVESNPASDLLVLDGGGLVPLRFVVEQSGDRIVVDIPEGLLDP